MTEDVDEEEPKRPIVVRVSLFLFILISFSVGLLGLFLYSLGIYVLIPQSVGIFDIIATFGSLLLTALLVILYGTMWGTQQTQNKIQQKQTDIQKNQEQIMELDYKPDVDIDFKGVSPNTTRKLQFEIRNKAQNGQARNFRIRSKLWTGLEEEDVTYSTEDEKYIGWPCESELKGISRSHTKITPSTCNPGEKICLEGRAGFTISNANERKIIYL